jgi:UDP-N-acetylglucosamine 2-epimerase|tara:strand:+ start:2987 stop:4036 length:1050 start_codon:yes stop_codon:yes gene_type:complete
MKKTIVTVTGIRPDFIRMSEVFKKLDKDFNHILVHTGQHYDKLLSDVFFDELDIRKPDYNLKIGKPGAEHFHQSADLSVKLIELLRKIGNVDCVVFLGDSNSVCIAPQLKKEGYKIAHIEAGMRSYDKRMLEEVNRVVCDHCSDFLFVYHDNYKIKLFYEKINEHIYTVGNTIVEVLKKVHKNKKKKTSDYIILDIHRPENFKYRDRLIHILDFADNFNLPVKFLNFKRTMQYIKDFEIDMSLYKNIKIIDLLSYKKFIDLQYNAYCIISDSGTAQEEPALLKTPVIVPRDYAERPESVEYGCSIEVNANKIIQVEAAKSFIENYNPNIEWLGNGNTSQLIVNKLKEIL